MIARTLPPASAVSTLSYDPSLQSSHSSTSMADTLKTGLKLADQ